MRRQENLKQCSCLVMVIVMVASVQCRPSVHLHQDDSGFTTQVVDQLPGNEEVFPLNGVVLEKEVVIENNKTDDAVKQFMQMIMNRPLGSKNMTGSVLGGTSFNACVQPCSAMLASVSDLHSCYRECMIDPYKYQASDTISLQLDLSR